MQDDSDSSARTYRPCEIQSITNHWNSFKYDEVSIASKAIDEHLLTSEDRKQSTEDFYLQHTG